MEMCAYCGEDVPAESPRCWKCGTELSGEEPPSPGDVELRKKLPTTPQRECPHCQAEVPAKALRCNECGRAIRQVNPYTNWVPAVFAAFGLVTVAVLVGLIVSFVTNRQPEHDPGRDRPLEVTYAQLERIYISSSANEQRRRDLWQLHHEGRFVHWTNPREGPVTILAVRPDGTLALATTAHDADPDRPEVVLALVDPAAVAARSLAPGKQIPYSARLDRFEDETIYLTAGLLDDEED